MKKHDASFFINNEDAALRPEPGYGSAAKGEPAPEKTIALASRPFMPLPLARFMLAIFGRRIWNGQVKDKAVLARMRDRPCEGLRY